MSYALITRRWEGKGDRRSRKPRRVRSLVMNRRCDRTLEEPGIEGVIGNEVEEEYQLVIKETEELRHYYEEQNRERIARIAAKPPQPGTEAIRAKLQASRAKLESRA